MTEAGQSGDSIHVLPPVSLYSSAPKVFLEQSTDEKCRSLPLHQILLREKRSTTRVQ